MPKRRLNARQNARNTPSSVSSTISRATSHAADVEAPIVKTGIEKTVHATESMARSPMRPMIVLYGLSWRKMPALIVRSFG